MPATILIVDEAPEHRDILSRLLRATGYHVIEAEPGTDAIDRAVVEVPDLILMALSLPGQRAWETTRHIHAMPSLAQIPILGATLFPTILSRTRARSAGYTDYVEKPFDLDGILDRINRMLGGAPTAMAA